ncbi:MAG: DinB family protein [Bryobacterales bacterium]|nr:DinB family protein [Bryobacterales bacterium]
MITAELETSGREFLEAILGLSPAQWTFKPAPERWSVAEVAEHLLLSEDSLYFEVVNDIMRSPESPHHPPVRSMDRQALLSPQDRSAKATAPEYLTPGPAWSSPEALAAEFRKRRDRAITYVRAAGDELRKHFVSDPASGSLDACQCFLVLSGHTRRHVEQILEIRRDPQFPRR